MRMKGILKVAPALALLTAASAWATSVRLVNLSQMVEAADRVFRGRCLSVKPVEAGGFPAVEVTFEVLEAAKGVAAGQTVVFRQISGDRRRLGAIQGLPSYKKGEEAVLFLAGDSEIGLTSPIGLGQGIFRLRREADGAVRAVNELDNRNLSLGLDPQQRVRMGLSTAETGVLEGGPAPVESLMSAVRKIEQFQARNRREK